MTRLGCCALLLFSAVDGLSLAASRLRSVSVPATSVPTRTSVISAALTEIESQEAFDAILQDAGDSLVVIDYATSWCGPCKVIAPKFEEMSEKYTDAAFYKVMGDANKETDKLMRSQGVRALPTFQYAAPRSSGGGPVVGGPACCVCTLASLSPPPPPPRPFPPPPVSFLSTPPPSARALALPPVTAQLVEEWEARRFDLRRQGRATASGHRGQHVAIAIARSATSTRTHSI